MKRFIAMLLCVGLTAPGCAMNHTARVQTAPAPAVSDHTVLADFASQLKVGTHVRSTITGTVGPTSPWIRAAADVEQTIASTRRTS